jgi:hypothetical protein
MFQVWAAISKWPDSGDDAIRVAQVFAAARPSGHSGFDEPAIRHGFLVHSHLDRGRFRDALRANIGGRDAELPYLAALGAIPADSASAVFDRWVSARSRLAHTALGWWAERADTAAIRRFDDAARQRLRSAQPSDRHYAAFEVRVADAYLALARRDSSRAIELLSAVPDSLCPTCYAHRLTLAQLLLATGRATMADSMLRRDLTALQFRGPIAESYWRIARARAAERTNATDRALMWYDVTARSLATGDPEARKLSTEVAERAATLRQQR